MSKFAKEVFRCFAQLHERWGFVPAVEFATREFAPLVKKVTEDIVAYVFVHDRRSGNADVVISMWVAPPHPPDDGLDNLMVGFKVLIASKFEVDDEFFELGQERIIRLVPFLDGLVAPIRAELAEPSECHRRGKCPPSRSWANRENRGRR